MKVHSLLLASLLILTGCATYGPNNFWTGGYNEIQLAPDVFRISFQGSAWSGAEQAQDFVMLRAAETALQHGFSYFAIMTSNEGSLNSSVTTPGYISTSGYVTGNTYYGGGTFIPGQTFAISHPRSGLVIKCFTTKPSNIPVLDAKYLQRSIRGAHNLPLS